MTPRDGSGSSSSPARRRSTRPRSVEAAARGAATPSSVDAATRSRAACSPTSAKRASPFQKASRRMKLMACCVGGASSPARSHRTGHGAPNRWSGTPLIVGANSGSRDRPQLKYAISDAERFARVLVELGGVAPAQEIILQAADAAGPDRCARYGHAPDQRRPARGPADRDHRALLGPRRRDGPDARRGSLRAIALARSTRSDTGRCPDCRARRVFVGRVHPRQERKGAAGVPGGRIVRHAGTRVPHVKLGKRGGAGIGSHPRVLLHALPGVRAARRRRSVWRRQGHAERGVSVCLQRNARTNGRHQGRRAASVVRHQHVRAPAMSS